MNTRPQHRGFKRILISLAATLVAFAVLFTSTLCALLNCSAPGSPNSSGCARMDMPKSPVSMVAGSVPACCQISQVPPARTKQIKILLSIERNVLPTVRGVAVAARGGAAGDSLSSRRLF
jgi:hypothetical protein